MGSCPSRQRVAPSIVQIRSLVDRPVNEHKVKVILVNIKKDDENTNQLLTALEETCGQPNTSSCNSFKDAVDHIKTLDKTTTVILIYIGDSYTELTTRMTNMKEFHNVRGVSIYSNKNEMKERFTEAAIQKVYGKDHLLTALGETLKTIYASPVYGYPSRHISFGIHQDSINDFLNAINSVQFDATVMTFSICLKFSRMQVMLSPSIFGFKTELEVVKSPLSLGSMVSGPLCGTAKLELQNNELYLVVCQLNMKTLVAGEVNIAKYVPPFPLKGLINMGHQYELPEACENRQLLLKVTNPKMIVEEKLVKVFVDICCTPMRNKQAKPSQ